MDSSLLVWLTCSQRCGLELTSKVFPWCVCWYEKEIHGYWETKKKKKVSPNKVKFASWLLNPRKRWARGGGGKADIIQIDGKILMRLIVRINLLKDEVIPSYDVHGGCGVEFIQATFWEDAVKRPGFLITYPWAVPAAMAIVEMILRGHRLELKIHDVSACGG